MKELSIKQISEIHAGSDFWDGVCLGVTAADAVGGAAGLLAYYGAISLSFGPAAPWVGAAFLVANVGCVAYGLS